MYQSVGPCVSISKNQTGFHWIPAVVVISEQPGKDNQRGTPRGVTQRMRRVNFSVVWSP
jgi:hypothetical protein